MPPAVKFPSIDEVRESLRCPACKYSLQGSSGRTIRCPECGREGELRALVLDAFGDRWHKAPWFRRYRALACVLAFAALTAGAALFAQVMGAGAWLWAVPAGLVGAWLGLLWMSRDLLKVRRTLAALAAMHAVYLAAVAAVPVLCVGIIGLPGTHGGGVAACLALSIFGALVIHVSNRHERRIARRLAAHLMAQWAEVDTMAA